MRNLKGCIMHKNKLKLIAEQVKLSNRKFTSLIHNMDVDCLKRCYKLLKRNKACGIDDITVKQYGDNLEENLVKLHEALKSKRYKPKPVRRVYIPKAGKQELRPLGIPCVEDKLVQLALKEILEAIFEQDFLDCSHGFRPNRSCHTAIKELGKTVMNKNINYIVEVDIAKFFDTVDHEWLMRCLKERIVEPNLLRLVNQFLKAGIMEQGAWHASELGTPQGGIISPLLANIYLHFVVDLWVEREFKRKAKGHVQLIRYCDDFVMLCENKHDAERFLVELEQRLSKFNLKIAIDKTRIVRFGKQAWIQAQMTGERLETFNFLGFTAYSAASLRGFYSVRFKTSKQNLARKLTEFNKWLKDIRNSVPLADWWKMVKAKVIGYYNYFGVNGNMRSLQQYYQRILSGVFKWINRRSQKKSMTWSEFMRYLQYNPLPTPAIKRQIW